MVNKTDIKHQADEQIRVAKEKHKLAKDMHKFKDTLAEKSLKRKFSYADYLYTLKNKFADKEYDQTVKKMNLAAELRKQ